MEESKIQDFWQKHPCGDALVGGLDDAYKSNYLWPAAGSMDTTLS
jgi:hypothetical protein